jgi:hypothetical protein
LDMTIRAIDMAGDETAVTFAIVDGWPASFDEVEGACLARLQEMGITRVVKAVRFSASSTADTSGAAPVCFGMVHTFCVVDLMDDAEERDLRARQEFNAMTMPAVALAILGR